MRKKLLSPVAIAASLTLLVGCSNSGDGKEPTSVPSFSEVISTSSESTTSTEAADGADEAGSISSSAESGSAKDGGKAPSASAGARIEGNKLYVSDLKPGAGAPDEVGATFENLDDYGLSRVSISFPKEAMSSLLIYPGDDTTKPDHSADVVPMASTSFVIRAYDLNGELLEGDRCYVSPKFIDAKGIDRIYGARIPGGIGWGQRKGSEPVVRDACNADLQALSITDGDFNLEIQYGLKGLDRLTFVQPVRVAL